MPTFQRIAPFLWFDDQAEAAAGFYTGVFPNSSIVRKTMYAQETAAASGRPSGSVMTVELELDGQSLTLLNGGPRVAFNEAVSLVINCRTQEEVDHFWEQLSEGGDPWAQRCGWLEDRYGVSWQVVPVQLPELLATSDAERVRRIARAMLAMKKLDLDTLRRA